MRLAGLVVTGEGYHAVMTLLGDDGYDYGFSHMKDLLHSGTKDARSCQNKTAPTDGVCGFAGLGGSRTRCFLDRITRPGAWRL